jgi:S1-C subfamily serine protease
MSLPPHDEGGLGDDEPGDDDDAGSPPHPMDRVWRHPSELPALGEPAAGALRGPTLDRARSLYAALGVGLVGALLTLAVLAAAGVLDQDDGPGVANPPSGSGRAPNAIADMARRVAPAIVAVRVVDKAGRSRTGSGVCIRHAGQVLTSDRLVAGYMRIEIVTAEGEVETARVIGRDSTSDLALLAIDGAVDAADLAAPGSLALGEPVYAVGADSSGTPWVSEGIVSSLTGLMATKTTKVSGLIETNALTQPAVAGGALLDGDGKVAGILMTTVIGNAAAVAVPIRFASQVADALRANGIVDHGWLGIDGRVTADGRFVISAVAKNGPSEQAGIKVGDVVVRADAHPINTREELMAAARGHWPGERISLQVTRARSDLVVSVKLAHRPRIDPPTTTTGPATTTEPTVPATTTQPTVTTAP